MRKNNLKALKGSTPTKLDGVINKIDTAIEEKKIEQGEYQRLIVKLATAMEKGVTTRHLAKLTGISHATIARWVKDFKSAKDDA